MAENRTICLWDAFRLDRIQTIKDIGYSHVPKFTSSTFDKTTGMLYVGDQQVQIWKALVDSKTEINALQVETLGKAIMKDSNVPTDLARDTKTTVDNKTGKVLISS